MKPVTPSDFADIRWHGHWIWLSEDPVEISPGFSGSIDPNAPESHGLFRKTFELDHIPDRVPARLTADSRYALYVNGVELGRGPVRGQFRRLHYDLYDLAQYLQLGKNVIAIYVKYYGREKAFWTPATPNKTLGKKGVLVFEADLGGSWLISDETWLAKRPKAWDRQNKNDREMAADGVPIEYFDAREFPHDWNTIAFIDEHWTHPKIIPAMMSGTYRSQPPTHPYGPLYPRPIAVQTGDSYSAASLRCSLIDQLDLPEDASPMDKVEFAYQQFQPQLQNTAPMPERLDLPIEGAIWIEVEMGRIVSGFVNFEIECPKGTVLDISYTEEPIRVGSRFGQMRVGTRYTARGSHDRFELFDAIGFRYAYLLVTGHGQFSINHFAAREYLHPWRDGASFECSDPQLDAIFKAGIRTVQLCSPDAFIDCPTREQRAWVGDGVVHQMVTLAANQDHRLAARYVELGEAPRYDGILPMFTVSVLEMNGSFTLPDWSIHWLHGVYNLYRYIGDKAAILRWMPSYSRVLRWYAPYQGADGLLRDVPEWNLVDWSSVSTTDTSSLLTAEWARALREFIEIADWLGEGASSTWASYLYEKCRIGFEKFWDKDRGSYVDHLVDGVQKPEMSQIAGALAIVSGLAPQHRWKRIIRAITDPDKLVVRSWAGGGQSEEKFERQLRGIFEIDWDVEHEIVMAMPFMSYVVHDAVALADEADRLPALYTKWTAFLRDGYDTIGENWGGGTHAHGWSCTPSRDMLIYTLGITPAEPGFTKARVAPKLGALAWARGCVPTPAGMIHIEIDQERVILRTPIPCLLETPGGAVIHLEPGDHNIPSFRS